MKPNLNGLTILIPKQQLSATLLALIILLLAQSVATYELPKDTGTNNNLTVHAAKSFYQILLKTDKEASSHTIKLDEEIVTNIQDESPDQPLSASQTQGNLFDKQGECQYNSPFLFKSKHTKKEESDAGNNKNSCSGRPRSPYR